MQNPPLQNNPLQHGTSPPHAAPKFWHLATIVSVFKVRSDAIGAAAVPHAATLKHTSIITLLVLIGLFSLFQTEPYRSQE
jgi:hypothetical protein